MNDTERQHISQYFDTLVNTDIDLDSFGIDSENFINDVKTEVMSRIQDIAYQKLSEK